MADSYSYDMQRLQQDAIRRAREMQARAQNYSAPQQDPTPVRPAQSQNAAPVPPAPPEQTRRIPPNEPRHAPPHEPPKPPHEHGSEPPQSPLGSIGSIFEDLMKDSERTLILVLILLLVEEKSDPEIIFALMYLIL